MLPITKYISCKHIKFTYSINFFTKKFYSYSFIRRRSRNYI